MTDVPTDRTDELKDQNAVPQPQEEAPVVEEAQADNSQPEVQTKEEAPAPEEAEKEVTVENESAVEPEAPAAEVPASEPEAPEVEVSDVAEAPVVEETPEKEVSEVAEAPTVEETPEASTESAASDNADDIEIPVIDEDDLPQKELEIPQTKEGIVERLRTLSEHAEQSEKAELDQLKQTFYRILKEERTQAQAEYIKNGGDPEKYVPEAEPLEEVFKAQLALVKEQRAKIQEAVERQKEVNLERKIAITEQIKALATTPEEANKRYDEFRKLQEEWKGIKPIPASAANEVWKNFQFTVEQYYDLLKENNALRDYDFKKNLEAKTQLCEAAEKLVDDPDIIHASFQLQQLHQEFREIGPVAKDLREGLWERFKTASSAINKRHAQYFEQLKEKEEENLTNKTALCEEIESIETANLQNFSDWDAITKKIIEIQQRWKEIGRAPKKMNTKIFERFRAACDNFFNKKAEHFKEQKRVFSENASKKVALCEQAEALKDSTDWNATTNKLVQLQKDWKEIGPVARKASNTLWERFNSACNYFFEQKKKVMGDQHKEETTNLTRKKTIIEKLEAIAVEGGEQAAEKVRALMDEWANTGHVPFREKDKIYAKYHDVIDRLFKELNLTSLRRNSGGRPPRKESGRKAAADNNPRGGLYHQYEVRKAELATYENNITFLKAHSKSGNALIDSMNKKIETLKKELAVLVEKMKAQEAEAAAPAEDKVQPEAPEAKPEAPEEVVEEATQAPEPTENAPETE